ncbi:MAG: STAS domain-containing protein [Rhodocyclaceae bacterium]|nr:STAS domain-containing protein [Rhodocyclaceae bacterium]MDZ4216543.1 STAS domain-containing protein [Rhodocyclaceae bacterium]
MELVEHLQGSTKVVKVTGRIDQTTTNAFQEMLAPWLDSCKAGDAPVVLDFSGVDYISSVGLRVLMLAAKQVKSQQGRIAIAALTPVVAEVFQISRFNMVFPVHPSVDAAVAALG